MHPGHSHVQSPRLKGITGSSLIQQPRLQANVEFSIADLADQTGDYTQELVMAKHAWLHYASYGSADGVADAALQII
jgi:hypothetical protein